MPRVLTAEFQAEDVKGINVTDIVTTRPGVYWSVQENVAAPGGCTRLLTLWPIGGHEIDARAADNGGTVSVVRQLPLIIPVAARR